MAVKFKPHQLLYYICRLTNKNCSDCHFMTIITRRVIGSSTVAPETIYIIDLVKQISHHPQELTRNIHYVDHDLLYCIDHA